MSIRRHIAIHTTDAAHNPQPRTAKALALRTALRLVAATLVAGLATVSVALLPAPMAGATTDNVTKCADSGTGSLRAAVANANAGDNIAFTSPCSLITLITGQIEISQDLTLTGPGADLLAVSGNHASRVFLRTETPATEPTP